MKLQARDLGSAVAERDSLRTETQKLKQQLKAAETARANAESQGSSTAATAEELEAAYTRMKQLESEAKVLQTTVEESAASKEKEEKRAAEAEAAAKASESKAAEQLSRAEKYKKRFVEDHEALKKFKAEKEKNEEELTELRGKLEVAEKLSQDDSESKKALEKLEKQLAQLQEELTSSKEQVSEVSRSLEQVSSERDELKSSVESMAGERDDLTGQLESTQRELQTLRSTEREHVKREVESPPDQSQAVEELSRELSTKITAELSAELSAAKAELKSAKAMINELQRQIAKSSPPPVSTEESDMRVSTEELDILKNELRETQEQATDDLDRKNSEIKKLQKELKASLAIATRASKSDAPTASELVAAEEIQSLHDEVDKLQKELREARETQSAGEVDPSSPMALAQRYDELRRLAEAGLEKDRELEKMKARLEDLEADETPPSELNNNEEADALRAYIHELQIEISKLREEADERVNEEANPARRTSLLSMLTGNSEHGSKAPMPQNDEDRVNELEGEVEALNEVTELLKGDIEKSRKRIKDLENDLLEERETSKRELESFARTLRGVDELRTVAESMSRQVQTLKTQKQSPNNSGVGFTDEVVDDFDGQMKMIESARDGFEKDAAGKNDKKQTRGFWGFGGGLSESSDDDMRLSGDDIDDDLKKIMAATKQKRKRKKKRRGSGNASIVSSFF